MPHHKKVQLTDIHIWKCLTSIFDPQIWMSKGENECPEARRQNECQTSNIDNISERDIYFHFWRHCQTFINLKLNVFSFRRMWHPFVKMSMADICECWTFIFGINMGVWVYWNECQTFSFKLNWMLDINIGNESIEITGRRCLSTTWGQPFARAYVFINGVNCTAQGATHWLKLPLAVNSN